MTGMQVVSAVAISVLLSCTLAAESAPDPAGGGFVTRQGSKLLLNGKEYRAIGVNIPCLHQCYLGTWFHVGQIYGSPEKAKQAMVAAIEDCEKSNLKFVRFFADPGYPRDRAMLYDKDPAAYWQGMDELFALCKQHNLKLIPSLQTLPGPYGIFGETGQSILDPNSKTYEAVHRYVREFVTRYKDDPTVLMWELVNEGMLGADVEMEGRKLLPKGVYPPGATPREDGHNTDTLSYAMIVRLYKEHAAFIKSLDPNHMVTSGDGCVREECTSRRETFPNFKFRSDTWREWLANNLASQPEPLDVFSYHFYGSSGVIAGAGKPWAGMTDVEWMRALVRASRAANAPVFIGEFGTSPGNSSDPSSKWLRECIPVLEEEGASLMAFWVWHFPWQKDLTLDSKTYPELVKCAGEFNRRHAQ